MKHAKITAFDLLDVWYQVLGRIWEEGEAFVVRYGSETTETKKLDVTIEIVHPENRPLVHEKAPCDMKYVMSYSWNTCGSARKNQMKPTHILADCEILLIG